jgi:hypothetical protein
MRPDSILQNYYNSKLPKAKKGGPVDKNGKPNLSQIIKSNKDKTSHIRPKAKTSLPKQNSFLTHFDQDNPKYAIGGQPMFNPNNMYGGFGVTSQTTLDPRVENAANAIGADCKAHPRGSADAGPTKAERKDEAAWDKQMLKNSKIEADEIARQKASEWADYTNTNLDAYGTKYGRKDKTFSDSYNKFITTNPNFAQEQSTLGLSPEQRYAMLYHMSGRSGSPDYAASKRLRAYMNLPEGARFTDQQLYEATQKMGGIDKYADWWRGGWNEIKKNGGDVSPPNVYPNQMVPRFDDGGEDCPCPEFNCQCPPGYETATQGDSLRLYQGALAQQNWFNNHPEYKIIKNPYRNVTRNKILSELELTRQSKDRDVKSKKYYNNIDKNRFEQRELTIGFVNKNIPIGVYDRRIQPNAMVTFQGDNISPINNLWLDNLVDGVNEIIETPQYDPIYVAPWDMLNPKQQQERIKKYGFSGTPYKDQKDYNSKTSTKKSSPTVPPVELPSLKRKTEDLPLLPFTHPTFNPQIINNTRHVDLPNLQQKSNYAFTWSPDGNKQQTNYFPTYEAWKENVDKANTGKPGYNAGMVETTEAGDKSSGQALLRGTPQYKEGGTLQSYYQDKMNSKPKYAPGGVASPQICYDPVTSKEVPCKKGAHKTMIFTENPAISSSDQWFKDNAPGQTKEDVIKNNEFTKEAEDLKNYLIKNQPGEDIEIYPTYASREDDRVVTTNRGKTLNEILRGSDAKTRLAFMAHHGDNLYGVPAGKLGYKLHGTTYDNCYLGSCFSGDIAASDQFKGLTNFHFRPGLSPGQMSDSEFYNGKKPGLQWLGVNPNRNSQTGEAGINNAFYNTTYNALTNNAVGRSNSEKTYIKNNPTKGLEYDINNPTNEPHIGKGNELYLGDFFNDNPQKYNTLDNFNTRPPALRGVNFKMGGGYFPPYHSYTPPRMQGGGDPFRVNVPAQPRAEIYNTVPYNMEHFKQYIPEYRNTYGIPRRNDGDVFDKFAHNLQKKGMSSQEAANMAAFMTGSYDTQGNILNVPLFNENYVPPVNANVKSMDDPGKQKERERKAKLMTTGPGAMEMYRYGGLPKAKVGMQKGPCGPGEIFLEGTGCISINSKMYMDLYNAGKIARQNPDGSITGPTMKEFVVNSKLTDAQKEALLQKEMQQRAFQNQTQVSQAVEQPWYERAWDIATHPGTAMNAQKTMGYIPSNLGAAQAQEGFTPASIWNSMSPATWAKGAYNAGKQLSSDPLGTTKDVVQGAGNLLGYGMHQLDRPLPGQTMPSYVSPFGDAGTNQRASEFVGNVGEALPLLEFVGPGLKAASEFSGLNTAGRTGEEMVQSGFFSNPFAKKTVIDNGFLENNPAYKKAYEAWKSTGDFNPNDLSGASNRILDKVHTGENLTAREYDVYDKLIKDNSSLIDEWKTSRVKFGEDPKDLLRTPKMPPNYEDASKVITPEANVTPEAAPPPANTPAATPPATPGATPPLQDNLTAARQQAAANPTGAKAANKQGYWDRYKKGLGKTIGWGVGLGIGLPIVYNQATKPGLPYTPPLNSDSLRKVPIVNPTDTSSASMFPDVDTSGMSTQPVVSDTGAVAPLTPDEIRQALDTAGVPSQRYGGQRMDYGGNFNLRLPQFQPRRNYGVNPYMYNQRPNPNVKVFGAGLQGYGQANSRLGINAGINMQNISTPNFSGWQKPNYNVGMSYRFQNGGSISIQGLQNALNNIKI